MIGRTNAVCVTSGGSGGVTTVDLPTHPASIAVNSGNAKATITLTYTDTDYISGVEVRYKAGGYPTSPTDGNGVTAEGAVMSIEIAGLTNGTKYYFRAYLYREVDGVKYYQTDDTNAKVDCTPFDGVIISGITPAVVADNYILIDTSGTFTMTVPDDITLTAYVVGGGEAGGDGGWTWDDDDTYSNYNGAGGFGGYVLTQQLTTITNSMQVTVSIGSDYSYEGTATDTILSLGEVIYKSSSGERLGRNTTGDGKNGPSTLYGNVGSTGGRGSSFKSTKYVGGVGAGNGGQCYSAQVAGGYVAINATNATNYGCSGGGGGVCNASKKSYGSAGKKGCIILTWDN